VKNFYYISLLFLFLVSCKSKEQAVAAPTAVEVKVPLWVSSRPNSGFKYVGIGFAEKNKGSDYQIQAKKAALYDLASEIKTNISSNSVLYTVQNNNNFNENFNSLIKLSNTDNLEGYQLIDSYENDKQYWVYYSLDKAAYAEAKAKKKQQTISRAASLIASSFVDEGNKDFSSSLKKRIQAFGVLTPYLNEEIVFDEAQTKGLRTVIDLTTLIQQQLQSISVEFSMQNPVLKPYQPAYAPLKYRLIINKSAALQNFPFLVSSDDDRISVQSFASTNGLGDMFVKVTNVEPINQPLAFSLQPDTKTLMGSDSVGLAGLTFLSQFVSTGTLKVNAQVNSIAVFIQCEEKNFGTATGGGAIEGIVRQKFTGEELRITDDKTQADFIIEAFADTKEDVSSAVLGQNYGLKLAGLTIQLNLRAANSKDYLYKAQVSDIFGYANQLDQAGLNAYQSAKLPIKLAESLFFLKRKVLVY
jgi:hypothetical protein